MWAELVRERGGISLDSIADAGAAALGGAKLIAVVRRDDEVLPAVAALEPPQAAAFLALGEDEPEAAGANGVLEELHACGVAAYLLKEGRVGGSEEERSIEVHAEHATAILDGIIAGTIEWEVDPDFGYRVAAAVPGIEGRDRFVLIPRFLYARTERVYDYAALVPELKRRRLERLEAIAGLDAAIVDAVR